MFGAFEPEDEPVQYGIIKPLKYQNPITVLFHGFWRFLANVTTARSIQEAVHCLVMPSGWQTRLEISRYAPYELPVVSRKALNLPWGLS